MKKLFAAFLIFLLSLSLSGCRSAPPALVTVISAEISVSDSDTRFLAESDENQTITLTLLNPKKAQGITYTYEGDRLTIGYGELSCITTPDYLSDESCQNILYHALSALDQAIFKENTDGSDMYLINNESVNLIVTAQKGEIISIKDQNTKTVFTLKHNEKESS